MPQNYFHRDIESLLCSLLVISCAVKSHVTDFLRMSNPLWFDHVISGLLLAAAFERKREEREDILGLLLLSDDCSILG